MMHFKVYIKLLLSVGQTYASDTKKKKKHKFRIYLVAQSTSKTVFEMK